MAANRLNSYLFFFLIAYKLLTTTCLLLACKATEMPRKVRDLVNVGFRYYHPEEQLLNADEVNVWSAIERVLLR